jgi:hypothetical protein
MANDIFDKLQIETTIKLTFPGLDIKEIKQSVPIVVEETTRKRLTVGGNSLGPVAGTPATDADRELVMVVVKLAKLDTNKGIQPVLVSNTAFQPAVDGSFKLEGDGSVAFWKGAGSKFKINTPPLYAFNPNPTDVVLDVYVGFVAIPKPKPGAGGAAAAAAPAPAPAVAAAAPAAPAPIRPPAAAPVSAQTRPLATASPQTRPPAQTRSPAYFPPPGSEASPTLDEPRTGVGDDRSRPIGDSADEPPFGNMGPDDGESR